MLGFEMEANNKTKDDGSAESPTSVLEDEVCFVFFCFFALFGSRDYEGKWRLGKQKGNIIKKKKKCKKK